jgi:hypothetical protein
MRPTSIRMLHKQAEYVCVGNGKHILNRGGTVMPTEMLGAILEIY